MNLQDELESCLKTTQGLSFDHKEKEGKKPKCGKIPLDEWLPFLPEDVTSILLKQKERLFNDFSAFFRWFMISQHPGFVKMRAKLQAPSDLTLSAIFESFKWCWFAVGTRCVSFSDKNSGEMATEALAPFLDFLNHSDQAQIDARYNPDEGQYEIKTLTGCKRGQQVFICYGPHDNAKLWVEYGFYLPENAENFISFEREMGQLKLPGESEAFREVKEKIWEEYHLKKGLKSEGTSPSWGLLVALRIRLMTPDEYGMKSAWKHMILGERDTISPANEIRVRDLLRIAAQLKLRQLDAHWERFKDWEAGLESMKEKKNQYDDVILAGLAHLIEERRRQLQSFILEVR